MTTKELLKYADEHKASPGKLMPYFLSQITELEQEYGDGEAKAQLDMQWRDLVAKINTCPLKQFYKLNPNWVTAITHHTAVGADLIMAAQI